jgi:hypothetical protein
MTPRPAIIEATRKRYWFVEPRYQSLIFSSLRSASGAPKAMTKLARSVTKRRARRCRPTDSPHSARRNGHQPLSVEDGRVTEKHTPGGDLRAVVLVEGVSDQAAVEALAERRGRDLAAEGVSVLPIGGAQAIGRFLDRFGPRGLDLELAGLCDAAEEAEFRRGLERAGLGADLTRSAMEELGFYVCVDDLEDELIRAHGADAVERVVDAHGDLGRFRTLQKQPEWRGRRPEEQLRRFMGSGGRRKTRYARLLVESLDDTRIPRPLDLVLTHV